MQSPTSSVPQRKSRSQLVGRASKKLSRVAEFSESLVYRIDNWKALAQTELDDKSERFFIMSPVYSIFGNDWQIKVGPKNDLANMSIRLINLSSNSIDIKYEITLANHKNRLDNLVWADPEGVITFDGVGNGCNNEWGNDDFIESSKLVDDISGFLNKDGALIFHIYLEVYGDLAPELYPLARAVQTAAETSDLIDVANKDLSLITKNLPLGTQKDVNRQQDDLISYRISLQASTEPKKRTGKKTASSASAATVSTATAAVVSTSLL